MKELPQPLPVVHLVSFPMLGHVMSPYSSDAADCWCEPQHIFWVVNNQGLHVLVVEHNDFSPLHRREQLVEQAEGRPPELAWINRALYQTAKYPTAANRDLPYPMRPPPPQRPEGDTR